MILAKCLSGGLGATFQDEGRTGWARWGIPFGGAMDLPSAQAANHLLYQRPDYPVLEFCLQGLELEILRTTWLSVTGAEAGGCIASGHAAEIPEGVRLRFSTNKMGVWGYIGCPGGWQAPQYFGSVSVYERGAVGRALQEGDSLPAPSFLRDQGGTSVALRRLSQPIRFPASQQQVTLWIYRAPQSGKFGKQSLEKLVQTEWTLSPASDRTGYRLKGEPLLGGPEISSEPTIPGTIQVPPDGQPIVTMPDGPTVGGYPKIACLPPEERWKLVRCRPGTRINFKWLTSY